MREERGRTKKDSFQFSNLPAAAPALTPNNNHYITMPLNPLNLIHQRVKCQLSIPGDDNNIVEPLYTLTFLLLLLAVSISQSPQYCIVSCQEQDNKPS